MYDIAVIGAGPAGATLARLLAPGRKVALFEKRDPGRPRPDAASEKCCGGLLAPDAQRALARLGLGVPREVLADPQVFAVRALDLASGHERLYQRHYVNIDRFRFDRWLAELLPDRVTLFAPALVTGVKAGRRGIIVTYRSEGKAYSLETRLVFGAQGAGAPVPGLPRLSPGRVDRYFAIEEWHETAGRPWYQALFDPAVTDYYAWTIPKNGLTIVGAALDPARDPLGRFTLLKRKLAERGFPLGTPVRKRGAWLYRPRLPGAMAGADGLSAGMALAGEAAGFVSPSSGEGISYALESAALLASAVIERGADFARAYGRATSGLRAKIIRKCLKNPVLYRPFPRRLVMASGWRAIALS
jgi:geranylgeranyl diphosphate/geranylgeranyl-bacteriochlorophyllide a reductase